MAKVTEISSCQRCGKTCRKNKLNTVQELWVTKSLCRDCYAKYQRSQWGYWLYMFLSREVKKWQFGGVMNAASKKKVDVNPGNVLNVEEKIHLQRKNRLI